MQNPFKDSIVLKIIIIAIIILVLLIPTAMIRSLIQERQYTFDNAVTEVGSKWGQKQAVAGPILTIPYDKIVAYDTKGNPISQLDYAYFLPDTLNIDGEMVPEVLKRGIYDIVGYKSTMKFNGKFSRPNFANAKISASRILWNNATISIAIMDMKGINENVKLNWGGSEFLPKPGVDAVLTYMGQPYDQFLK